MTTKTDIRHGSPEWFHARERMLTGTDAAAILGKSRFRTPLDVWYRLVLGQGSSLEDNAFLRWGRVMEPIAADEFRNVTGMDLTLNDRLYLHESGILCGTPDGFIRDPMREDVGIWECKAPSAYTRDEWSEGKAPEYYVAQLKFYLLVTGLRWGSLCALLPPTRGEDELIATTHVALGTEERAELLHVFSEWWERHVKLEEQPAAIASDMDLLRSEYGDAAVRTVELAGDMVSRFKELQDAAKAKTAEAMDLKAEIAQQMGEAMFAVDQDGNAMTWKPRQDGVRVLRAAKKLPKDAPAPEVKS